MNNYPIYYKGNEDAGVINCAINDHLLIWVSESDGLHHANRQNFASNDIQEAIDSEDYFVTTKEEFLEIMESSQSRQNMISRLYKSKTEGGKQDA